MNAPKNSPVQIDPAQNDLGRRFNVTPSDEIDFFNIMAFLVRKRRFILFVVIVFTLLAAGYSLSITPVYKATIGFILPQEISQPKGLLTKNSTELQNIIKETKKSLYQNFLMKIQSYNFQREVFDRGNFLEKFIDNPSGSVNSDALVLEINKSVSLTGVPANKTELSSKPTFLEMTGSKPDAMAEFFNALVETGINAIPIEEHLSNAIGQRINNILSKKALLFSQEKKNLEQQVLQEKKKALQEKNKLEQQYSQNKNKREKEIALLTKELDLARSMSIEENNFKSDQPLNGAPRWYLYGAKILDEELMMLKSNASKSDIFEKAKLVEDIKRVDLNNAIKLESLNISDKTVNLSDNIKIKNLNTELKEWESFKSIKIPNFIVIDQPSIPSTQPISNKKASTILSGLLAGLIIGSLLAFFQEGMRNVKVTQNQVSEANQKTNSYVFK